ncbi:MAG: MotA/TolQ/ExbB proton channel family protein [Candidatus Omnitrophota bacterium]|jgi:biopolymer transport protein ExbB
MFDIIQKGGAVMYPIILCSVIALAIVIERISYFYRIKIDSAAFMNNIEGALKYNKIAEAVKICEDTPGPTARVIKAGILKYDRPRQEIREAIEDAGHQEIPGLEKHIKTLAAIAHISPLLGILGTVIGMIKVFNIIQLKAAASNPVGTLDLAGGVWTALLTTAAGLIVAIPTITAYHYLASRVQDFTIEMERSAAELINILSQRIEGYK